MAVARGEQADAEGVFDALIVMYERCEELGEIERAAAADADDARGVGSAGACEGGVEDDDGGLTCGCTVSGDGAACGKQLLLHAIDDRRERGRVDDVNSSRA